MSVRRFVIGCLLGFFTGIAFTGASQRLADPISSDYHAQIIRNTQLLADLQRQITELDKWHDEHIRDHSTSNAEMAARVREIEVTMRAHERILWVLITGIVGLLIKTLADFLSTRRRVVVDVEQVHPHKNHDETSGAE